MKCPSSLISLIVHVFFSAVMLKNVGLWLSSEKDIAANVLYLAIHYFSGLNSLSKNTHSINYTVRVLENERPLKVLPKRIAIGWHVNAKR